MARTPTSAPLAPRLLRAMLFGLALLFVASFVALAVLRLNYPFELEWIEGGSLAMVRRVLEGRPLYAAPSLEYVAFNYAPLYFWVSALATRIWDGGFAPLRLVSILAALGCGALIYRHVALETARREAGVIAACFFFATYRLAGAWLDVARSDSLHLVLLLGGFLVLRADATRVRGPVVAGALVALAFLAKQSAVVAALPVLAYLLVADRLRGAIFAATVAGLIGGSTLALDAASGGWYRYFAFELPGRYLMEPQRAAQFWKLSLLGPLAVPVLGGVFAILNPPAGASARGRGLTWAAAAGLVLSSWSVYLYPGAFDNVLMPACAGVALAFGLGWDAALAAAEHAEVGRGARLVSFAHVAALLQFATLLYNPLHQLPGPGDAASGAKLVEGLRLAPGAVLVPCHDFMTARARKGRHFHEMAFMAVAKSNADSTATRLMGQLREALRERRWQTIVLDKGDWLWDEVERWYEPRFPVFPDEKALWPATGMRRRPEVIFVPRADSTRNGR